MNQRLCADDASLEPPEITGVVRENCWPESAG